MEYKCKKHEYCKFQGNGSHEGCKWHGIVDECTSDMTMAPEYKKLFNEGHLAYATSPDIGSIESEQNQIHRCFCNHRSGSSGFGFILGLVVGILFMLSL